MTDIPNNHTLIDFHRPAEFPLLRFTDKFVFVGSCFSDEMSRRLKKDCIDTTVNPFGTIYNPMSIHDCLQCCLSDKHFDGDDVLSYQDKFFTPYHATSFDRQNAGSAQVLQSIRDINSSTDTVKNNADILLGGDQQIGDQMHILANASSEITESMNEIAAGSAEITKAVEACLNISSQNHDNLDSLQQEVNIFKVN